MSGERWRIIEGECVEELERWDPDSVDSIVTDPPYGIGFMGKGWDCSVPGDAFARAALRVLKPGGHLVAFAATRTVHRLAVALEDAGFELRDQIAWLQWQGFPKSLDVSKAIDSAAGAEREVVGTRVVPDQRGGGISSERTVETGGVSTRVVSITTPTTTEAKQWEGWGTALKPAYEPAILARKPLIGTVAANVLEHGTGALNIDGCRFGYGDQAWPGPGENITGDQDRANGKDRINTDKYGKANPHINRASDLGRWPANIYQCPKPSRGERTEDNNHPTVKPVRLMRWLVRLVTPPGGLCVDPFAGSGTTGIAATQEGVRFVGIEREADYCQIARARIVGDAPLFNRAGGGR